MVTKGDVMETSNVRVRVIEPKKQLLLDPKTGEAVKLKVAGYARVSTDTEDQLNSFNAQRNEFERRITSNPDWEFVGMYADEGITGTDMSRRPDFLRMLDDAKNGKINLILCKSVSRFSRNNQEFLTIVKMLKEINVFIRFDEDRLDTSDPNIEFLLTMLGAFAQEEVRKTSERIKTGVQYRMQLGQRKMIVKTTLGYVYDSEGKVVIDETTKNIVIEIFNLFIAGYSYREIAKIMTKRGYLTGTGKNVWTIYDIEKIITNEKYVGDFVMQKTVVVDYLSHKAKKNDNIVPKYIVENHHEAIISREKFEEARAIRLAKYSARSKRKPLINLLSEIFICENCLRPLQVVNVHPRTKYEKKVYTCKSKCKESIKYKECDAKGTIDYVLMMQAVDRVFRKFYQVPDFDESVILDAHQEAVTTIIKRIDEYKNKIEENTNKMESLIKLQTSEKGDITKYQGKFNELKRNNEFYNDEIVRLQNIIADKSKAFKIKSKLLEYKNNGILNYDVLTTLIKGVIRRKDNSVRFVLSKSPIEINESTINGFLNEEPVYSDMVTNKTTSLLFDVIKLEEESNGSEDTISR